MIKESCNLTRGTLDHTHPQNVVQMLLSPGDCLPVKKTRCHMTLPRDIDDHKLLQSDWFRGF